MSKLVVLILSAGYSSRMGRSKALLSCGDSFSFHSRIVSLYRETGISRVTVVREDDDELKSYLLGENEPFVTNPQPEQGMHSSIVAGFRALPAEVSWIMVHPVDVPLVEISTLNEIVTSAGTKIVVPEYNGYKGHPVRIHRDIISSLVTRPEFERTGLKAMYELYRDAVSTVYVQDRNILLDFDTPLDYKKYFKTWPGTR